MTQKNEEQYKEYLNDLKKFYSLKKKYEDNKENFKKRILKSDVSMETKKKLLSKQKFKCINCGKEGGSIFLKTSEGFKATCGNISNPCDLNIDIKKIKYTNIIDEIYEVEKVLEESKRKISLTKLDYLFKYIEEDNAVEKFEELKEELNINQEKYNKLLEYYYNITNNEEKNQLLNEKTQEFYTLIAQYKEFIELFKNSEDKKYLKDAVDLYINKIININKNLLELKYKINFIENHEEEHFLIQKKFNKDDFDLTVV